MSPLVSQGLELAAYGMGVVFVFLTLLVFVTMAMSKLVHMMEPAESLDAASTPATSGTGPDAKQLAVISAAIHQHRQRPR